MPNYHTTRLRIFLQTVYYNRVQNSSSSFQLRTVSFDLFSHCAVSSLKLMPALNFLRYLLKTGELLFCSCCCVSHRTTVVFSCYPLKSHWKAMLIATLTHFLLHFLLSERFACVDGGWRGKCLKLFYWNVQGADTGNGWVGNLPFPRSGQCGEKVVWFMVV